MVGIFLTRLSSFIVVVVCVVLNVSSNTVYTVSRIILNILHGFGSRKNIGGNVLFVFIGVGARIIYHDVQSVPDHFKCDIRFWWKEKYRRKISFV